MRLASSAQSLRVFVMSMHECICSRRDSLHVLCVRVLKDLIDITAACIRRSSALFEPLQLLFSNLQTAKSRAPTHPHPAATDKPGLSKIMHQAQGFLDKAKDKLMGHH